MATSGFPSFSRLPPEIRRMIWNAALPDPISNPLFFWRRIELCIWSLDDKDDDYSDYSDDDYDDDWVPRLIDPEEMGAFSEEIPLLEVNKEAHRVAQAWIQRQSDNYTIPPDHNTIAVRCFKPQRDIVFCPNAKWKDFLKEVSLVYIALSITRSGRKLNRDHLIRRVALPQQLLADSEYAALPELFRKGLQMWCRDLYIVVDAPATLREFVPNGPVRPNWELEVLDDFPRASCTRQGGWQVVEGSSLQGGPAYESAKELLGQITKYDLSEVRFAAWVLDTFSVEFEIRFARAVKR
ncbi:hypothetical protein BP00DRAFT_473308 [Aspergillus indologenus CBS 114.80]|uniref:2EXR domain-containing protein n=1 Tax=Aspergillus indologenus CBS 114.80 TaxID=1450541 RepID=A0A2V5IDX3_9EURO|nr:hypothetical protein BP00DRAFT_473308 [Aspergillus indologenus CBS 114.80]